MAVFKCKMCGGSLTVAENATVADCEYCGSQQTLPRVNDEKIERLYDRANHFRQNSEFDKAMGIYEQILEENGNDAESYWSIILCRYGIQYVEDPATHKRIPTVNRIQYTSIFDDDNYKSAIRYADAAQKALYEQEAAAINDIQKRFLDISQKEDPFDVFICYKETGADGQRTHDSVYANELYHELTAEGFKVFFARITLEDKLGVAYEPYIFSALNSAKVMVVIGTRAEYFNAVWVKNEWSRYLTLIKGGAKKVLIPAYRDMDPYDLPQEFAHLQAQDMNKLGFMPDLVRGIKKIIGVQPTPAPVQTAAPIQPVAPAQASYAGATSSRTDVEPLLKRVTIFLESGDFENADIYCEKVLDLDPENAYAYLYKMLVDLRIKTVEGLKSLEAPFVNNPNYQKATRYADDALLQTLTDIAKNLEAEILESEYQRAVLVLKKATTISRVVEVSQVLNGISGYKDADTLLANLYVSLQANIQEAEEILLEAESVFDVFLSADKKKGEAESAIIALNEQIASLTAQKEEAAQLHARLPELQAQREEMQAKVAQLTKQLSSLGFFSFGKKKSVGAELEAAKQELSQITPLLSKAEQSPESFDAEIKKAQAGIEKAQATIEQAENAGERLDAWNERYSDPRIISTILANPKLCEIMLYGNASKGFATLEEDNTRFPESFRRALVILNGLDFEFGRYPLRNEQDICPILWRMVRREGDYALLITKHGIDSAPLDHSARKGKGWHNSTLRAWLNDSFLRNAFNDEERRVMANANVVSVSYADNHPYENKTTDAVFLLNPPLVAEALSVDDRIIRVTPYAQSQGAKSPAWWIRETQNRDVIMEGDYRHFGAYVDGNGNIISARQSKVVLNNTMVVRPSIYVSVAVNITDEDCEAAAPDSDEFVTACPDCGYRYKYWNNETILPPTHSYCPRCGTKHRGGWAIYDYDEDTIGLDQDGEPIYRKDLTCECPDCDELFWLIDNEQKPAEKDLFCLYCGKRNAHYEK